jgi:uncharacterized membrane protein YcaP (DUF421 family)
MDIFIRATVIFWAIYVIVRLLGKRELAQLTPFELLVLIATGDLIQQGVTHNDFSMTAAIIAVATFGFWASLLSWGTFLSRRAEALFDGMPSVLVRDGEVIDGNLRRDRVTMAELESEMRLAGIAHLRDVAWAIVEPKGRISFIKRNGGGGGGTQHANAEEQTVA